MICYLLQLIFNAVSYGELRTDRYDVAARCRGGDLNVSLGGIFGRISVALPTHRGRWRAHERTSIRHRDSSEALSDHAGAQFDPLSRMSQSRLGPIRPDQT